MKLSSLLMLLFCMNLSAGIHAQEAKFSVAVENGNIREIIRIIKQQSDYTFVYNVEELDHIGSITMNVKDSDVRTILDACLKNSGYTYSILDKVIVIRKAELQQQEQIKKIRGIVTDKKKAPLPGVTVLIKGTTIGVSTDQNGRFEIVQPKDSDVTLIVSFIGMKTQTIVYKGKELNIVMEEDSQEMEEVVVTGYQVINRRKNTGSSQRLKMDDIMTAGVPNLDQMLEGRISGMTLVSGSGEVGVAPKIRIRGTSTLIGNREPLWVVDGIIVQDPVPISAEELNDPDYINRIGNAIAGLNPQDIERLDVLKDAAATALYGTKAANGVIVITTKKGRMGAPIINYNMTTTFRQRPRYSDRKIELMNSKERIQFSRELNEQHYVFSGHFNYVGYEGLLNDLYNGKINDTQFAEKVAYLETLNTDWFKLLTEDSFSHQHTVSISGGSNETRYYASIGYSRDNDVLKGNYNERYTSSLNLESTLTEWLNASFQIQGNASRRKYNQSEISPMDYAYNTSRAIPAYDENGKYAYYEKQTGRYYRQYNILNELENSYTDQHSSGITVTANLRFGINSWLNANAIISYTNSNTEIEGYWGEKTYHVACERGSEYGEAAPSYSTLPYGGELSTNETRNNSYTARLQVNADKYFGAEEQHNINLSAGFEMSSSKYKSYSRTDRCYYPDRGMTFVSGIDLESFPDYGVWLAQNVPSLSNNLTNILSGYATLSYSYHNYFTANVNARVDGSNKFGDQSNDKFLPIWSASAAYNFSEHEALKTEWIDYMTLKASFGYQGNMLESQSPVMLIKKLPVDPFYNELKSSIERHPNPNLKWEKTSSFNVGLQFSLLRNRVQFETQYYYKRTKDAFMTKEVASMNGVDSYVINGGDVENKGYSVDITVSPITRADLYWTISTSFSKDKNTVKNDPSSQTYDYTEFLNGTAVIKGKAVNTFYSYDFIGLNPVDGGPLFNDMEDQKHELYGLNKYETFTRVLKATGRREPYMSGGLSTMLRYKNIRMNAMFSYSLGAKTRLFRMFNKNLSPEYNVHRDFLKRWQNPGDELKTNIPALESLYSNAYWNYANHYSDVFDNIQTFAEDAWTMYDYSDVRVVSANYLKCSSLSFTYEFGKDLLSKIGFSRLSLSLSGTNLFTLCSKKLKGQTPTQGGFSEIQLSDRPTYSFGLSVSF